MNPIATEVVLATSPAGNAVLHVYGSGGVIIETLTGSAADMRAYASQRHPSIPVKEITK